MCNKHAIEHTICVLCMVTGHNKLIVALSNSLLLFFVDIECMNCLVGLLYPFTRRTRQTDMVLTNLIPITVAH
jgi:hypothetical protein